jgi:hypothetical protein
MRKLIIYLVLILILFLSCEITEIQYDWDSFNFDEEKFDNIEEVQRWVDRNIDYAKDINSTGKYSYWRYPSETLDDGEGDCEDMAILIIAIIYDQFNYKCNLVLIDNEHAIVRYKGCYYHSTTVGKYDKGYSYTCEYEYDDIPLQISMRR